MSTIEDLIPVAPNQSDETTSTIPGYRAPNIEPSRSYDGPLLPVSDNTIGTDQTWWDAFASAPSSQATKMEPIKFDWQKSNADRYVNSDYIKQIGFDPYPGSQTIDGKTYDTNE